MPDAPDGSEFIAPSQTVEFHPEFGALWSETDSASLAASADTTFTETFIISGYIYVPQSLYVYCATGNPFYTVVIHNTKVVACAYAVGNWYMPLKDNPALFLLDGDTIQIYIINAGSGTATFGYALTGSRFLKPDDFGRAPMGNFSASPLCGFAPLNVAFTDLSTQSPNAWEWYFDGVTLGDTIQNPSHSYTTKGLQSPKLKVYNNYGYDVLTKNDYIAVAQLVDGASYTEVDPNSHLSYASNKFTYTNLARNEDAYVYKDYGVEYFDDMDIIFNFKLTALTSGYSCWTMGFANNIDDLYNATGYKLLVYLYNSAGAYSIYLICYNGTSYVIGDYCAISLNTDYYCRLKRASGSTTPTLDVYTDSLFSSLLDTLSITNANLNTKWRYHYPVSAANVGISGVSMSGYVNNIGIGSP